MTDRYIEKSFLWLLCISLLLHLGVFAGLYYFPPAHPEPPKEPVFIDLQQMPELKQPLEPRQQETKRRSEQRNRVEREMAPRGDAPKDSLTVEKKSAPAGQPAPAARASQPQTPGRTPVAPGSSAASLLKPKEQIARQQLATANLFPGANRLAKLEESYRRKFENDIAEGDTRFLNSDDIVFGSFLRRFEGAVYGVWRYPQEAALRGIEGITPVRITFNRRGEITNIQQLESSGARILDEEVLRTLRAIGPVGGFPKGYDKDEFHLIAFFQYGGSRRSLR
jgi:protein TonB